MKTRIFKKNADFFLALPAPHLTLNEYPVVARLHKVPHCQAWMVVDVRLKPALPPLSSNSCNIIVSDLLCVLSPRTAEERQFIQDNLTDYEEREDGSIWWTTFSGLLKGSAFIDGDLIPYNSCYTPPIFHSRDQAEAAFIEIMRFWKEDENDPAQSRIENPWLQKSAEQLLVEFMLLE